MLNLHITDKAKAKSNLPKTIPQIHQPMIDLYLAESSSVYSGVSSNSGWFLFITSMSQSALFLSGDELSHTHTRDMTSLLGEFNIFIQLLSQFSCETNGHIYFTFLYYFVNNWRDCRCF
jgi:hypothetical protein